MKPNLFGQRVKNRRTELNLTQAQLGEIVGISQVSIKKIEAGGSTRHGRKIAEALKTTLELLETGVGDITPSPVPAGRTAINETDVWPFSAKLLKMVQALSADQVGELEADMRHRIEAMLNRERRLKQLEAEQAKNQSA